MFEIKISARASLCQNVFFLFALLRIFQIFCAKNLIKNIFWVFSFLLLKYYFFRKIKICIQKSQFSKISYAKSMLKTHM